MAKEIELEFTGERIVGKTLEEVAACCPPEGQRSIDRYMWAKERVRGSKVIDCACGVGYGSSLISQLSDVTTIYAVDLDWNTLDYAKEHYQNGKISLCQSSMTELEYTFKPRIVDTIVSLESLEHVPDPTIVLNQFKRLLKPGGNIIASLPVIPTVHFNPYHKFEVASFDAGKAFFELNGFRVVDSWYQDETYGIYELEVMES